MKSFAILFQLMPKEEGEDEFGKVLPLIINREKADEDSFDYILNSLQVLKQVFKNVKGDDQSAQA